MVKTGIYLLYFLAVVLLLLAALSLTQVFTAPRAVENVLLGYRIAFGPLVDVLKEQAVSMLSGLFLVLFVLLLAGSGLLFGMARLLMRSSQQDKRIKELEALLREQEGLDQPEQQLHQ